MLIKTCIFDFLKNVRNKTACEVTKMNLSELFKIQITNVYSFCCNVSEQQRTQITSCQFICSGLSVDRKCAFE